MSTNPTPEYFNAEKRYLEASTDEDRIEALEEMLKLMPKHKSAESMRANIKARYKKLKEKMEVKKKKQKQLTGKEGIKKQGVQVVLIGLTPSGKSSLLSCLTNAQPEIASYGFTTKSPLVGVLNYEDIKFQIIDMPAINYEFFDQGITNTADILLIIITNLEDIKKILPFLKRALGKKIIVFNKSDLLNLQEKRKIEATLKSRKYNFCIISCKTLEGIEELKKKLVENSGIIRVYTKEPRKQVDKEPILMKPNTTVKDVAEKILHGFSSKVKEARVTGPSSKFPNQKVGLSHIVKDKDVIEFKTK